LTRKQNKIPYSFFSEKRTMHNRQNSKIRSISTGIFSYAGFELYCIACNECLAHLSFSKTSSDKAATLLTKTHPEAEERNAILPVVEEQIHVFLTGKKRLIDVPIDHFFYEKGSAFQKRVWDHMLTIPYGTIQTYGQIAAAIGDSKCAQAVGQTCGSNPLALFIPCHRVVSANGIGGFNGGLAVKRRLLSLEQGVPSNTDELSGRYR
jgi:methylated-DNA-[protein]-cysteine S-methyltransferase